MQVERYHLSRLALRVHKRFEVMFKAKQQRLTAARRRQRPSRGLRAVIAAATAATARKSAALCVAKSTRRHAAVPSSARQRTRSTSHAIQLVSGARRRSVYGFGEEDSDFAPIASVTQLLESADGSDLPVDTAEQQYQDTGDAASAEKEVRLMAVAHRFLSVAPAVRRDLTSAHTMRSSRSTHQQPLDGHVQDRGALPMPLPAEDVPSINLS